MRRGLGSKGEVQGEEGGCVERDWDWDGGGGGGGDVGVKGGGKPL